jgi:hypothetical protein
MPRLPATSYRFDRHTLEDITRLGEHLRLSSTGVLREAVRRLAAAELPRNQGQKKIQKKPRTGIDRGDTTV